MEVLVDGEWVPTRIEMDYSGLWYLVDTPYKDPGLNTHGEEKPGKSRLSGLIRHSLSSF